LRLLSTDMAQIINLHLSVDLHCICMIQTVDPHVPYVYWVSMKRQLNPDRNQSICLDMDPPESSEHVLPSSNLAAGPTKHEFPT